MSTSHALPHYNTARRAAALTQELSPPVLFDGVTARVFPLKANMARLRAFCDQYLNMTIPKRIVHFQPALPFVYLAALHYGKMSAEVANLGWVSQHEVAFLIPLEWSREENGKLVFQDWATVAPFIFVDNDWSLAGGREVYGWPKVKAWLTPETNPWMSTPRSEENLLTLSTMVFPEIYQGERQQPRVLVEIDHEPPLSVSQLPPDLENPFNPLLSLPQAILSSLSMLGNLAETITSLPVFGYAPHWNVQSLGDMLGKFLSYLNPWSSNLSVNNITLKQFRDAEDPTAVCYQAILNSQICLRRYHNGGLLGDANLLRGDPSGGFRVKIHRYAAQPIIESLGLEVTGADNVMGHTLSVLKPHFPFWIDMDLGYGFGDPLCWREKYSKSWSVPQQALPPKPVESRPEQSQSEESGITKNPYNTAQGAALQEIAGPFRFSDTTIRVLPLLADEHCLHRFCAEYLDNDFYRFEPWGSYVYLLVTNYDEMSSETNNIGWWAEREVTFSLPVKWYAKRPGADALLSLGLVSPFAFANRSTAAITGREVDGRPILHATISSPGDVWLADAGPTAERHLLTLSTEVLPSLFLGQQAEERTVLEIHQSDVLTPDDARGWQAIAAQWGQTLLRDHRAKVTKKRDHPEGFACLKALALELLANEEPFNEITLKQFRDATSPIHACYQATVLIQRSLEEVYQIEEIEERMHVRIHRYPTLPIVELLGLQVKKQELSGGVEVDTLQPIRPFWLRAALRQELGKNLSWRIGATQWQNAPRQHDYFTEPTPTRIEQTLVAAANAPSATRPTAEHTLKALARHWSRAETRRQGEAEWLTRSQACAAVEQLEPQMILESILSSEWGQPEAPRSRRGGTRKPDFCIRGDAAGEPGVALFTKEGLLRRGAWYAEDSSDTEAEIS